jgi:cobalt-zinc-cadmium efflux system protein
MMEQLAASRHVAQRALIIAFAITLGLFVAEVAGGLLTGSLALLSDAGHMLSDVGALGLSIFALWMATRPPTPSSTYGFHRVEVLAALANGLTLLLIAGYIFWEAVQRFQEPPDVKSAPMLGVATAGLLANLACMFILSPHRQTSINVRGAFLHVLGDLLGSTGAIVAGVIMLTTGWFLADPLISVLIGVLILVSSGRLLRDSLHVLLEAAPPHIDTREIASALTTVPGVQGVHDLHVWTVTSGFVALSCHCEVDGRNDTDELLIELCELLHRRFNIRHVTIQPESRPLHDRRRPHSLPCCTSVIGWERDAPVDRPQGPC